MLNDIQEIKSFLSLLISSKDQLAQLQANQPVAELYHSLLVRGLDEKQVFMLLSKAVSDLNGDPVDRRQIYNAFCKRFVQKSVAPGHSEQSPVQAVRPFSLFWDLRGSEKRRLWPSWRLISR